MRFIIRFVSAATALTCVTVAQQTQSPASKPQSRPSVAPPSAAVKQLLADWADSLRGVKTLRVRFNQEKHLRVLRKPRISSGEVLLVGKQLLMRVSNKRGKVETELAVQDGEVRIHYPKLRKLEVYPRDDSSKRKPPFPMMIEDVEELPREYTLKVERDGKAKILVMTPRDKKSPFTEVRARFENDRIAGLEQKSKRGDRVVLDIQEFTVNPKLDLAAVQLDVPDGTSTVRVGTKQKKPKK